MPHATGWKRPSAPPVGDQGARHWEPSSSPAGACPRISHGAIELRPSPDVEAEGGGIQTGHPHQGAPTVLGTFEGQTSPRPPTKMTPCQCRYARLSLDAPTIKTTEGPFQTPCVLPPQIIEEIPGSPMYFGCQECVQRACIFTFRYFDENASTFLQILVCSNMQRRFISHQ